MNISKVSFFSMNPHQNFKGVFREVKRSTYEDREQRFDIINVSAIYHPNKYETEKEIKIAMDNYNKNGNEYNGGMVLDGGTDMHGNPTKTKGWDSTIYYSCKRGERLPY